MHASSHIPSPAGTARTARTLDTRFLELRVSTEVLHVSSRGSHVQNADDAIQRCSEHRKAVNVASLHCAEWLLGAGKDWSCPLPWSRVDLVSFEVGSCPNMHELMAAQRMAAQATSGLKHFNCRP